MKKKIITENIPQELRNLKQWVVWQYVQDIHDKVTKYPRDPNTERSASTDNPQTWGRFRQACTEARIGYDGVGFVFHFTDPYCGVDLDHCRNPETGTIEPWALEEIQRLNSYTEASPSGQGVHIIIRGEMPDGAGRKHGPYEAYDRARFFTVTGQHIEGTPPTIEARQHELEEFVARHFPPRAAKAAAPAPATRTNTLTDAEIISRAMKAKNGAKFTAVFNGDISGYPSHSEADLALCSMLAFWADGDAAAIDSCFRQSQLVTEKWERADYRARTIAKACDQPIRPEIPEAQLRVVPPKIPSVSSPHDDVAVKVKRWPMPPDETAYYGVLGTIARELEPFIEADSAALLMSLVTTAGVAMGRGPYLPTGAAEHRAVLFTCVVGDSGENKSDSWWPIHVIRRQLTATFQQDGLPIKPPLFQGVSTGEGLLHQIRDERRELVRGKGKDAEYEEQVTDPGVKDKRLLIVEMELARLLAVMGREGNTVSDTLRTLYDSADEARSSPKGNPIVVTGPHVGFIGHVTPQELERKLREVEMFNGFSNRFAWVLTHRIHSRPNPPTYTAALATQHAEMLASAIERARSLGAITRDDEAQRAWDHVYERLRRGEDRRGLAREVCARAQVMVMRCSLIFAALDGSPVIRLEHHEAALALWDYLEQCAGYLFDGLSGDPVAEVIHDALKVQPRTRTEISGLFRRHVEKSVIDGALKQLETDGRAWCEVEETAGRPREIWHAKPAEAQRVAS